MLDHAYINLAMAGVGVAIVFVTYLADLDFNLQDSTLQYSLSTELYSQSILGLIVACAPMVIDIIFDAWFGISSKKDQHYCCGRAVVAAIVLPSAIYLQYQFLSDITDYNLARDFVLIFTGVRIAFVNVMLFCLCIADRSVFTVRRTSAIGFILTLNAIIRMFASATNYPSLKILSLATGFLTIVVTLCLCGIWIYHIKAELSKKSSKKMSLNDISAAIFMTPFTIGEG
jgi:hypothetical protein